MVLKEHVGFYLDVLYAFYRGHRSLYLRIILRIGRDLSARRSHCAGAIVVLVAPGVLSVSLDPRHHRCNTPTMSKRLRYPPAPPTFLPPNYNAQLILEFVDFVVRCQQGSGSDSINYITSAVLDRIRRNVTSERVILAHTNRALRMMKAEFPRTHALWTYVEHPDNPQI